MPVRTAQAHWEGRLQDGRGTMRFGGGAFESPYSAGSRFGSDAGSNPEELIGAAHAGCFSMALALFLEQAGYIAERIHTEARVHLDKVGEGYSITGIDLQTEARIPEIDEETFLQQAEAAKENCPVSQALRAVEIRLDARLVT